MHLGECAPAPLLESMFVLHALILTNAAIDRPQLGLKATSCLLAYTIWHQFACPVPIVAFGYLHRTTALSPKAPYSLGPAVLDCVHGIRGVAIGVPEAAAQGGWVFVLRHVGDACSALPCWVRCLAAGHTATLGAALGGIIVKLHSCKDAYTDS